MLLIQYFNNTNAFIDYYGPNKEHSNFYMGIVNFFFILAVI